MSKYVFKCVDDSEIPYRAVSLVQMNESLEGLKKDFIKREKKLDPPRYLIESEAGDTWEEYDAESIKEGTPEEQAQWEDHQKDLDEYLTEHNIISNVYILGDGILLHPSSDAWEIKQKRRYIEIPEEEDKKRLHWIMTELLKTPGDLIEIIGAIIMVSSSGVPEEKLAAMQEIFRRDVLAGQEQEADTAGEDGMAEEGSVDD